MQYSPTGTPTRPVISTRLSAQSRRRVLGWSSDILLFDIMFQALHKPDPIFTYQLYYLHTAQSYQLPCIHAILTDFLVCFIVFIWGLHPAERNM